MKYLPLFPMLIFALALFATGCYYDNDAELHPEKFLNANCDTTGTISFASHIQPILNSSCGVNNTCHGSTNTSGIALNSYSGVKLKVDDGRLYSSIIWDGHAAFMPKNSTAKLNDCYITRFRLWIEGGALNN